MKWLFLSALLLPANVIKNFGLEFGVPKVIGGQLVVPAGALVQSLDRNLIFVMEGNRARAVEVSVQKKTPQEVVLGMSEKLIQARVVVKGANFVQTLSLASEEGPVAHDH